MSRCRDNFQKFETPLIKDRLNISLSSLGAVGTAFGSSVENAAVAWSRKLQRVYKI